MLCLNVLSWPTPNCSLSLRFWLPCLGAMLCFGLMVSPVQASETEIRPSISLRGTYDDNLFYDEKSDFELAASPELEYSLLTARSELSFNAGLDFYEYLEEDDYSRVNQAYSLSAARDVSQYASLSLDAQFRVDHTFEDELEEIGVVAQKQKRYRYGLQPALRLNLSPRDFLRLQAGARKVDYKKAQEFGNRDYDVYSLDLLWGHELNQTTLLFLRGDYSYVDLEDHVLQTENALTGEELEYGQFDQSQQIWQLTTGLEHDYTRNLSLNIAVGGSLSKSEYTLVSPVPPGAPLATVSQKEQEHNYGLVLETGLDYEQELYSLGLDLSRNITQSADGEEISRNRATLRGDYDFSSRLQGLLRLSFLHSETTADTSGPYADEVDSQTYDLSPGLRYDLSRDSTLELRYRYRAVQDKADNDFEYRNRIYLEYRQAWPMRN